MISKDNEIVEHEGRVSVLPYVRLVPAGIKDGKLQISAVLTPDLAPQDAARTFDLKSWIKDLHSALDDQDTQYSIPVEARFVPDASTLKEGIDNLRSVNGVVSANARKFEESISQHVATELRSAWIATLQRDDESGRIWKKLAELLVDSLDGGRVTAGEITDPGGEYNKYKKPGFGPDGQLAPRANSSLDQNEKIDTIIDIPHAELASMVDQIRGGEAFCALQDAAKKANGVILREKEECARTQLSLDTEPDCKDDSYYTELKNRIAFNDDLLDQLRDPDNTDNTVPFYQVSEGVEGLFTKTAKFNQNGVPKTAAQIRSDQLSDDIRLITRQIQKDEKELQHYILFCNLKDRRESSQTAFTEATEGLVSGEGVACKPIEKTGPVAEPGAEFDAASDVYAYGSWEQYDPKVPRQKHSPSVQAYFAIQSSPTISRLFGLVIDLEMEIPQAWLDQLNGNKSGFFVLSSPWQSELAGTMLRRARPWTLTKLRLDSLNSPTGFWPADIAELKGNDQPMFSRDGFVAMGLGWNPKGGVEKHCPRFEVSSLDARGATEMEIQRRQNRREAVRTGKAMQILETLSQSHTLQTRGFTIMDRMAAQVTARQLAAMHTKNEVEKMEGDCIEDCGSDGKALLLEAADITIGQRLDVGVPDRNDGQTEWRPLLNRIVTYDQGAGIERHLKKLLGDADEDTRTRLESPPLTAASRLLPRGSAEASEAVIEQAVALWDGGPMGVYCGPEAEGPPTQDVFPFSRSYSIPSKGGDGGARPPRQRFGWAYRFLMRNVYIGGVSVPTPRAEETPWLDAHSLAYPGTQGTKLPYQRFLRQERIDAPQVLLPRNHAVKNLGLMGYEQGRRLIVRSVDAPQTESKNKSAGAARADARIKDLEARAVPNISQRIVVVPAVSQDEAARFGALDSQAEQTRPFGTYRRLQLDEKDWQWNVAKTNSTAGIDQSQYLISREIISPPISRNGQPATKVDDGIAQTRTSKQASSYFADPAASFLAFGLRRRGALDYLGSAENVDLRISGSEEKYGDLHPVVLTLAKTSGRRAVPVTTISQVMRAAVLTRISTATNGDIRNRGDVAAWDVQISLTPGEEFELDMWLVPTAEDLARRFALIESLAVIKSRAKGENVCDITLLKNHFKELLQDDEAKKIFEQKFENDPMLCDGFVTTGGMLSPKPKVLMAIARIVHDLMKQCPIPQLAAVTNTELVHASNRPAEAPRITVPSDGFYQPQVQSGEPLPLMALRSNDIPSDLSRDQHFEPGSNGFLLDGDVEIDLSDTDTLEIVAQVAMPPASIFDNSENRRSLLKKRAGLWPEFIDRTGEAKSRSPRDVFGFNVDIETDLINFDHSEQVLVRIDELETDVPVVGEVRFNLRDFFGQRSQNDAPNASNDNFVEVEAQLIGKDTSVIVRGRCSHKQSFDDTKSRIMTLRARGLSRTAGLFDTVNTLANRTFEQASPLAPSLQSREGASMRLILPATTRPAKCDTLTPHPVFLVTDEVSTDEILKLRKPLVRIKLQRGWFSSGEGEQIGLVVWPPNLKESDTASLNANKVPKRATLDGPSRNMELAMFADDDLGPGGKFVTRRGADPVRGGPRDSRHFLGLDNFSQLEEIDANGETLATYRPNEIMPVDETLANLVTLEDGAQEESAQLQSTLNVGLILFTPRFNMEEEYWYADVDLGPRQASDPFVRLGLVRYQPNTSAALRVSNPVTQWIQLLPERKVTVVSKKDKLKVNVTGLATESAKEIDYKVGPPADESDESSKARIDRQTAAASPLIRAVLARETTNERYGPQRETLVLKTDTETGKEAHAVLITNSVKNGLGNWELDIDRKLLETADPGVQFVLYLEEIEMRRPATYENEPVSPTDLFLDDPFVSSGPRFAMRVELGNFLNSGNASDDQ